MSTKIGIITEGAIDDILLPILLERIARDRANFSWPTIPDDLGDKFFIRKRGHGGVLEAVRKLVKFIDENPPTDHAFFVILLDRRTKPVQEEVRKLISGKNRFVLGIAIEEIEAWWLADRTNTSSWLGLSEEVCASHFYWKHGYKPEKDPDPKKTLDELTRISDKFSRTYGNGNVELTMDFVESCWRDRADIDVIEKGCHQGFKPFCKEVTQALRREKSRQGRLF